MKIWGKCILILNSGWNISLGNAPVRVNGYNIPRGLVKEFGGFCGSPRVSGSYLDSSRDFRKGSTQY